MSKKQSDDELIPVLVLVDCAVGKAGTVANLTAEEVAANVGNVDPNPAAVASVEQK